MDAVKDDRCTESTILKQGCFRFKEQSDGSILTVHHTTKENCKIVRIRFIKVCFSEDNKNVIAIDHRGNVFVLHLMTKRIWKWIENIPNCTVIRNVPQCPLEYIIGTKDGKLMILNIQKMDITKQKKFSNYPIEGISFSTTSKTEISFLIYSNHEAILISLASLEQSHRLEYDMNKISIKYASFIPHSDKIFACFSDDSVHIWSAVSLNTIRRIHPIRMRDRYLKQSEVNYLTVWSGNNRKIDILSKNLSKDYSCGVINSLSLSLNGKYISLSTIDDFVMILSTIQYEIIKMIKLTDSSCKSTAFLPHVSSSIMLYLLTSTCDVLLLDCANVDVKALIQTNNTYRMITSNNGKLIALVFMSGEIRLFKTSIGLNMLKKSVSCVRVIKDVKDRTRSNKIIVDHDLFRTLSRERLIPILREYGTYPAKYRHLIWCSLLELPNNNNEFMELLRKGAHPTVPYYYQNYHLKDATALRNLLRILSSLTHWSKIFGQSDFLPNFVYPFLKIMPNSSLLLFELLATILLNHCQLWFEFAPLEPLNYLGIIENILTEFEPFLSKFYKEKQITAKIYAWPLMSTAFSEVLDDHQWHHLWDNIISNRPEFFAFCIVAYNSIQKCVIMALQTNDSIENFFHDQNIIEIKKFVNHANEIMEKCPQSIHPRRYMKPFEKLPKGFYPKFENYPMEWMDIKNNEIETLRLEGIVLDKKIRELDKIALSSARQLEQALKQEEHENRMKEVEKLYNEALYREEERIACQRKIMLVHQKQNRDRKAKALDLVRESTCRRNVNLRKRELDALMRSIEKSIFREETDMQFVEENIKMRAVNSLADRYEIESKLKNADSLNSRYKSTIDKLKTEKQKLAFELKKLEDDTSIMENRTRGNDIPTIEK